MPYEVAIRQVVPRTLAGPNWEVYGHWNDDPQQLRTEVFYLLSNA